MKSTLFYYTVLLLSLTVSISVKAAICPDPANSSLANGEIPTPWLLSPLSSAPQIDLSTHFKNATLLVSGIGRGVVCTYQNSLIEFSIWQPRLVKIPASIDYRWLRINGGYCCNLSLEQCQFELGEP